MVGVVGSKDLPNEPSEEEFRLGLRNGLILCNVINKIHPGSVPKVVENPAPSVPPPDGAALSAYQYFENVRNFLVAVQEMKLPTFEASDLEKMRFDLQQREIEELKYILHNTREGVQMMRMEWSEELYNLEKHLHGLAQAAAGYHKVLEENRQLYNQVQDLKGSIRVYCRVRPFLPGQVDSRSTVDFIGENGNLMIVNPAKQGKDARGQAKTLMFVHISPELDAYGETISTLKFAERVATVELGAARSNKESGEVRELKEEIANLKNALAKKEAEAEQLRMTRDSRSSPEIQRMKAGVSPLHSRRQSVGDVQAHANRRQPMEDVGNIEVRNASIGGQKISTYAQDFPLEELIDASHPTVCDEDLGKLRKLVRRPSPDRKLTTLDRGSHTKNKIKHDILEEQEIRNWPDKVIVNKHISIQSPSSQDDDLRPWEARELVKQETLSEMYYQRYHANPRKIYPDCEEEQLFLQQQNEMRGALKSRRPDMKGR